MYKDYGWKFDEEVANQFDKHVRQSVHMYDEFHKSIINMSKFFIEDHTNILDVGTSTGEFLSKLNFNETCKYIGIDTELAMINKAKEKLADNVILEVGDILTYDINNCSVVNMMLVLQFIKPKDKQLTLNNVYKSLNKGGALFLTDKIKTENTEIHDIYNELYYDFKLKNNLTHKELFDKNKSLRGVQKTITLNENIDMLKISGFKSVDIFMKYNNFVGLIAIK